MIINSARQFFLMAIISPAVVVGIFHWVPSEKNVSKSVATAAYIVGFCMAVIFVLINVVAITGSKLIASASGINMYDAVWFSDAQVRMELVVIHLIIQLICPVGFFLLAAAYVRHRRHNYSLSHIYNLMPLKWKYLEIGLILFAVSLLAAGVAALLGKYYTYLWVIYFLGAVVAGIFELKSVKLPPREAPEDLK
jgi:hypothetical protein